MRRIALALSVWVAAPAVVQACPTYGNPSPATYTLTGSELYQRHVFSIVAGGTNSLQGCGFEEVGYVTSSPDASFYLSGMDPYYIEIRVQSACDAVLLVNSSTGTWYFDDDRAGDLDPLVVLDSELNGRVDVWVGSYASGEYCDTTLSLETFYR